MRDPLEPITLTGSTAPDPPARHDPQTSRNRAGYANRERAPRACSITVPHIAIAPMTHVALLNTPERARFSGDDVA
jgi:hypothetical protein